MPYFEVDAIVDALPAKLIDQIFDFDDDVHQMSKLEKTRVKIASARMMRNIA